MRNNPSFYNDAECSGDVWMRYFYTDRTDIVWATYYDQYRLDSGTWRTADRSHRLHDSDTRDYLMITDLTYRRVRVRADHYVTTNQGDGCFN